MVYHLLQELIKSSYSYVPQYQILQDKQDFQYSLKKKIKIIDTKFINCSCCHFCINMT